MLDHTRLTRLITLALASCAVTWAFAAGALARPDSPPPAVAPNAEVAPPPAYKVVPGDTDKAPSVSTAPAYQPAIGDNLKTPDRAAVDRNLASLARDGKTPGPSVAGSDDNTDTIALITAIAAMLVALAAVTYIVIRPQRPVLRA